MNDHDAFDNEEGLLVALGELASLSKPPTPREGIWPPWQRIRAALPADCELPEMTVNVLVDLAIDSTGLVTRAAVGHIPKSVRGMQAVAVCVGPDEKAVIQPPVPDAPPQVAEAVAVAHIGERFIPGERDGVPVAVRLLRVGIGIAPGTLQRDSVL